ncbi:MAG: hypothetical protein K9J16_15890 [Melioribacteraceae bacterium]|nr:hypothetical protein [Melioribacteraceae bacterium]MCF8354814.1 hypothetical protein [Melioribacteraceae bacterium]MCF8394555.1 hypothetical protein [Melioribacteraceae bacterium]MCF8420214.1 hypothetical protein [Melioribacteraceae bacterium]
MKSTNYTVYLFLLLLFACSHGIEPEPESTADNLGTGISGKVTFIGTWSDSVTFTHVVLFKNMLVDPGDFSAENVKYISESIPKGTTEFTFNSTEDAALSAIVPGKHEYLVVAQTTKPTISLLREDWFVAGVYYMSGSTTEPGEVEVEKNKLSKDLNIICDFNNPPPQPPAGEL